MGIMLQKRNPLEFLKTKKYGHFISNDDLKISREFGETPINWTIPSQAFIIDFAN